MQSGRKDRLVESLVEVEWAEGRMTEERSRGRVSIRTDEGRVVEAEWAEGQDEWRA